MQIFGLLKFEGAFYCHRLEKMIAVSYTWGAKSAPGEDRLNTLESGHWSLGINAARGGGILFCRYRDEDVLRPASAEHHSFAPLQLASFPLVPFSNRVNAGRFDFDGQTVQLAADMPGEPNAIHGHGWLNAWAVLEQRADQLAMRYVHQPADWPWAYTAEQVIRIAGDSLVMALTVRNDAEIAMPAGLGFHPYFVRTSACRIRFNARKLWMGHVHGIPDAEQAIPDAFNYPDLRELGSEDIDHCYSGWNGEAEIVWPENGLAMSMRASEALRHLVVYTPPGEDFFCLEPVSNMNDAVNWLDRDVDTGLRILAPGETLSAEVTFTIRPISSQME